MVVVGSVKVVTFLLRPFLFYFSNNVEKTVDKTSLLVYSMDIQ